MTAELNIALGRPSFMSTVHDIKGAAYGNDGDMRNNFHTLTTTLPHWWAVDFGPKRSRVARVRVTNVGGVQFYRKYYLDDLFNCLAYLFG